MILNPSKRRRKAFSLAFKIILSYVLLNATKRFRSKSSYRTKINALHEKNAQRIKGAILDLNGLFIKVGQLLSNLSSVLPKAYGNLLESLQDNTPYSEFSVVRQQIESELGETISALFSYFNEIPLASASIGQVHKAKLKTNEDVVVKIQHSYIDELAKIDLDIIEKIHKKVNRYFKVKGLDHAFEQVKQMILEELDYSKEANSMGRIKKNCENIEGTYIPKVYTEYSTKTILVLEFCEGMKITNTSKLNEWGINTHEIADKVVFTFCEMILNHGIYHADPHPGNLMVDKEGRLILLDFGAVGELKEEMRANIAPFLRAIIAEDDEKVMESLKKMGFVGKGKDKDEATRKIVESLTEFLQDAISLESINFENIKDSNLFKLQKELSLKELTSSLDVPKDWILLERTLLLLYGICTAIAPDYKAMDTIKPYLKKLVFKNGGLKKIIFDTLKQQATTLLSFPKKIDTVLTKASKGDLEFKIKELEKHTKKMYASKQQLVLGIVSSSTIIGALLANYLEKTNYENLMISLFSLSAVLLIYSFWKNRK